MQSESERNILSPSSDHRRENGNDPGSEHRKNPQLNTTVLAGSLESRRSSTSTSMLDTIRLIPESVQEEQDELEGDGSEDSEGEGNRDDSSGGNGVSPTVSIEADTRKEEEGKEHDGDNSRLSPRRGKKEAVRPGNNTDRSLSPRPDLTKESGKIRLVANLPFSSDEEEEDDDGILESKASASVKNGKKNSSKNSIDESHHTFASEFSENESDFQPNDSYQSLHASSRSLSIPEGKDYTLEDHANHLKFSKESDNSTRYCDVTHLLITFPTPKQKKDFEHYKCHCEESGRKSHHFIKDFISPVPHEQLDRLYYGLHRLGKADELNASFGSDADSHITEALPVRTLVIRLSPSVAPSRVWQTIDTTLKETKRPPIQPFVLKKQGNHLRCLVRQRVSFSFVLDGQIVISRFSLAPERYLLLRIFHVDVSEEETAMMEAHQVDVDDDGRVLSSRMNSMVLSPRRASALAQKNQFVAMLPVPLNMHLREASSFVQWLINEKEKKIQEESSMSSVEDVSTLKSPRASSKASSFFFLENFDATSSIMSSEHSLEDLSLPGLCEQDWIILQASWPVLDHLYKALVNTSITLDSIFQLESSPLHYETLDIQYAAQLRQLSRDTMIDELGMACEDLESRHVEEIRATSSYLEIIRRHQPKEKSGDPLYSGKQTKDSDDHVTKNSIVDEKPSSAIDSDFLESSHLAWKLVSTADDEGPKDASSYFEKAQNTISVLYGEFLEVDNKDMKSYLKKASQYYTERNIKLRSELDRQLSSFFVADLDDEPESPPISQSAPEIPRRVMLAETDSSSHLDASLASESESYQRDTSMSSVRLASFRSTDAEASILSNELGAGAEYERNSTSDTDSYQQDSSMRTVRLASSSKIECEQSEQSLGKSEASVEDSSSTDVSPRATWSMVRNMFAKPKKETPSVSPKQIEAISKDHEDSWKPSAIIQIESNVGICFVTPSQIIMQHKPSRFSFSSFTPGPSPSFFTKLDLVKTDIRVSDTSSNTITFIEEKESSSNTLSFSPSPITARELCEFILMLKDAQSRFQKEKSEPRDN